MKPDYQKAKKSGTYTTRSVASRSFDDCDVELSIEELMEDVAVTALSQLDEYAYRRSIDIDSNTIMENQLLPKSLPWYKPYSEILRTLPRDIDDMPAIWHAGNPREHCGEFGYGNFDQGGVVRIETTKQEAHQESDDDFEIEDTLNSNKKRPRGEEELAFAPKKFHAAARRSDNKGVINLAVSLPPPKSLESALLDCVQQNSIVEEPWFRHDEVTIQKAKTIVEAERAELSSSMPLYWRKIDEKSPFHPPAFTAAIDRTEPHNNDIKGRRQELHDEDDEDEESELIRIIDGDRRKKKELLDLMKSCTRKWNVSVRVGGVSSRPSLSSPSSLHQSNESEKIKETNKPPTLSREEMEPMYRVANLPSYIQSGKIVPLENAAQMDAAGLRSSLGAYDCRASATSVSQSFQAMNDISKKDASGRNKRICVGRTRLVWSNLKFTNNDKSYFTSHLDGQKFETLSYKRPREVRVQVRLNGKLLRIPPESIQSPTKQKTPNSNRVSSLKGSSSASNYNRNWQVSVVNKSIENVMNDVNEDHISPEPLRTQHQTGNPICMIDFEAYTKRMTTKLKIPKGKKDLTSHSKTNITDDQFIEMKYGGTNILKQIPPKLVCLPLDDGYMRTRCEKPGKMEPISAHDLLNSAARDTSTEDKVCSVCWTGSEISPVMQCVDCNVLVHLGCCYDPGEFTNDKTTQSDADKPWYCTTCKHMNQGFGRKSQRAPKTPMRFKDSLDKKEKVKHKSQKPRQVPTCYLCPHSGGAMSLLDKNNGNSLLQPSRWAHEICRIWCKGSGDETRNGDLPSTECSGISDNQGFPHEVVTCSICGMSKAPKDNRKKTNNNKGFEKMTVDPGLIRCAAMGCSVMFHPMCATLTTKLRKEKEYHGGSFHRKKLQDIDLCQQYTLDVVEVNRRQGCFGNRSGEEITSVVPVGFCGIHNPKREKSLYGCSPAGEDLPSFMHIPYYHQPTSNS